jgi:hypothetical protein
VISAIARLAPDVTVDSAVKVAEPIIRRHAPNTSHLARVVPLLEDHVGATGTQLWVLFGGAALLLLVACSTAAGLLLGETAGRRHDIAVRVALGGGTGRLLRQLAIELALLATVAVAGAVLVAMWTTSAITALAAGIAPRMETAGIDLRAGLFASGLAVLTVCLFGGAQALALAGNPVRAVLAEAPRFGTGRLCLQRLVVGTQIAVTLLLLVAASMFAESMLELRSRSLGFRPDGLAVLALRLSRNPSLQPGSDGRPSATAPA